MHWWRILTAPFRRAPRRPLSARQPAMEREAKPALGMEAIDMEIVNAAQRRNAALERVNTFSAQKRGFGGFLQTAETGVAPLPDDETYAARYHRAYNEKKGSQTDE